MDMYEDDSKNAVEHLQKLNNKLADRQSRVSVA